MPQLPITADITTTAADALTLPAGSTAPAFQVQFTDGRGEPVDMDEISRLTFSAAASDGSHTAVGDGRVRVVDASTGIVEYRWRDGETDRPGRYFARFTAQLPDGRSMQLPTDGRLEIIIKRQ